MYRLIAKDIELLINVGSGVVSSLKLRGVAKFAGNCPIFNARLRDLDVNTHCVNPTMAQSHCLDDGCITYTGFGGDFDRLTVQIKVIGDEAISWYASVTSVPKDYAIEWIEVGKICLPRLIENDPHGGKILFPYNEGMILSDEAALPRYEPEFPSSGAYFMFPNMVCSQFMAYLLEDIGIYIGAHDPKRALKGVDFYRYENGISLQMRLYSGVGYGEDFKPDYPIVWQSCQGNWRSAAEIYRCWFEKNLPSNIIPTVKNSTLPGWYEESPLIVTYPVRGIHDTDTMEPNALFPYTNALPILNRIKTDTGCRIMALLMHWEGTAPWAPPYMWPPFGGTELFNEFRDALHKSGDLLGVYCSGFGYTLKSTLTDYNCEERIKNEDVLRGVCHSPQNKPELGITCTPYQRYGYDICPASKRGREILKEGYTPIFESGVDYAQILDQNHGGGQYMCFSRDHDHPSMPGEWMTSNMQNLLRQWNENAPKMIFGCESAAAGPFIG
ncbi:MAG: hypothetical protein J6Q67_04715, partial [Clostridia bacterium]|nr:hypothetical protein [Clostridia bacterium]